MLLTAANIQFLGVKISLIHDDALELIRIQVEAMLATTGEITQWNPVRLFAAFA